MMFFIFFMFLALALHFHQRCSISIDNQYIVLPHVWYFIIWDIEYYCLYTYKHYCLYVPGWLAVRTDTDHICSWLKLNSSHELFISDMPRMERSKIKSLSIRAGDSEERRREREREKIGKRTSGHTHLWTSLSVMHKLRIRYVCCMHTPVWSAVAYRPSMLTLSHTQCPLIQDVIWSKVLRRRRCKSQTRPTRHLIRLRRKCN